jgi:L-alanine-DL-glutamate epimerase-like enolase superfamily enzyme
MQSIHLDKYMVRSLRGHYVKTNTDGIGYVMFDTKAAATAWAKEQGTDHYVVKVRIGVTPVNSGRIERVVAVRETRPKTISQTQQEFRF